MGKKPNTKAKEKKLERKAMEMKMNSGVVTVKKANAQENPIDVLPSFQKFLKNGVNLKLETQKVRQLDEKTQEWIVDLTERNMKEMYVKSEWGWDGGVKKKELMEDAAWYLIAKDADTDVPVAFSHYRYGQGQYFLLKIKCIRSNFYNYFLFRYDMDHDDDVLYCYEIQLEECVRRKGLGEFRLEM